MFLFLILPILVSGFICCHILPSEKYKLHRFEGQYLYLKSAKLGLLCLALSTLSILFLNYFIPPQICSISINIISAITELVNALKVVEPKSTLATQISWLIIFSTSMLVTPFILMWFENIILPLRLETKKVKEMLIGQLLSDSPLDFILYEALIEKDRKTALMLSLSDRKVYVGQVISMGEPNEIEGPDQEVKIIPIMSGYRDKDTLKVKFTTHYDGEKDKDLTIVLRQDLISSVSEFEFDTYNRLNPIKKVWKPIPF